MKSRVRALMLVIGFLVCLASLVISFSLPVYAGVAGSGWVADRLVYPSDNPDQSPSMATDSNTFLYAVSEQCVTSSSPRLYKIIVSRSTDGGDTWSELVSWASTKYIGHASMAIDPYDDNIYIAYERKYTDGNYDIFAAVYRPTTGWEFWIEVDTDADNDRFPSIASEYWRDTYNRQYIAYQNSYTASNIDLMFAKSTNHGKTWYSTKLRGEGEDNMYVRPSITAARGSDGHSYIYIAYAQGFGRYSGEYLCIDISTNGGFCWTQKLVYDGYGLTTRRVERPSIVATHGSGTVVAAWESDACIYYAYSTDDGDTWNPTNPRVKLLLDSGRAPTLTVDGQGSTNITVHGYIHLIYWYDFDILYRKTHYVDPSSWSDPKTVNDNHKASEATITSYEAGLGLTTQRRPDGVWYPAVAWTDYRSYGGGSPNDAPAFWDVYYSTPGANYRIDTMPSGLQAEVDGLDYTAPASFNWIAGYAHAIYATCPQSGGTGIEYRFWGWSDGGAQSHSIVVGDVDTTITASYVTSYYVTLELTGIEATVNATVDGRNYDFRGSVGFWWEEGSDHDISIPSTVNDPTISGKRYVFTGWSGLSDSASETITLTVATPGTLTANYKTQFYLTMSTNFGSVSPGNGWHDNGLTIDIFAEAPAAGSGERYVWKGWTGIGYDSYTGMDNPVSITMNGPITQEALWTHQWYIKVISVHDAPTPSQWIDEGSNLTVGVTSPAETVSGQTQWRCTGYSIDGGQTQQGTRYTLEKVQAPHEIEFYWIEQVWLQVDTTVSGSTVEGTGWYDVGTSASISATTPYQPSSTNQFIFTLWTSAGTNEAQITDPIFSNTVVTMNNYYTVQANWQEQWYITVISPYNAPTSSQWVNTGESFTASVTSPADADGAGTRYRCTGYRIDEGDLQDGTSYTFENVQTPHKIEFEWIAQYQLTIDNGGYGTTTPTTGNWYDTGEWVTITMSSDTTSNTTDTRYLFNSWTGTGLGSYTDSENPCQVQMNSPITEVAGWKVQYYLTIDTDPAGLSPQPSVSIAGPWYDSGTQLTLTAETIEGYTFDQWDVDETSQGAGVNPITITMDAPHTAIAHYSSPAFPLELVLWIVLIVVICTLVAVLLYMRRRRAQKEES